MKYQSNATKGIKLAIILLFLFWVANFFVIINTNGIKDATVFSVIMIVFAIVFISLFLKGIYIVIEANNVKYVHMFLLRKLMPIEEIRKIQKGSMGGTYTSLSLIGEKNGDAKEIKISTVSFKKETLKQFVVDLKKQNPQIEIDKSVDKM